MLDRTEKINMWAALITTALWCALVEITALDSTIMSTYIFFLVFVIVALSSSVSGHEIVQRSLKAAEASTKATTMPTLGLFRTQETYDHDSRCFTQGLQLYDGFLYESCGLYGRSSLRKMDPKTLQIVAEYTKFENNVFAEGITIMGGKLYMLEYKSRQIFVFNAENLEPLYKARFRTHRGEGWGLTNDGEHLVVSDGSSRIAYWRPPVRANEEVVIVKELKVMDPPESVQATNLVSSLHVVSPSVKLERDTSPGEVKLLNDLEMVNGLIYANIWYKDVIVVVDPAAALPVVGETGTGGCQAFDVHLKAKIDMSTLYPVHTRRRGADCLNGIAYDEQSKDFLLTGKMWPHLFRARLSLDGYALPGGKSSKFQKRRRRRTVSGSGVERDLEGEDSSEMSSSSDPPPPWLHGMLVALSLSCMCVCMLLGLLIWVERGLDDQAERYIYEAAPGRGAGAGIAMAPSRASKRGGGDGRGGNVASDDGVFSFGVDDDDDEEEGGGAFGPGPGSYKHPIKGHRMY